MNTKSERALVEAAQTLQDMGYTRSKIHQIIKDGLTLTEKCKHLVNCDVRDIQLVHDFLLGDREAAYTKNGINKKRFLEIFRAGTRKIARRVRLNISFQDTPEEMLKKRIKWVIFSKKALTIAKHELEQSDKNSDMRVDYK